MHPARLLALATALLGGCSLYFGSSGSRSADDQVLPDATVISSDGGPAPCGGPVPTVLATEMQWAACLSISAADFEQTKAYTVATGATTNGACAACHDAGGANEYFSLDHAAMLRAWQQQAYVTTVFAPSPVPSPSGQVVYQMTVDKAKLCGTYANSVHPAYDCSGAGAAILADVEAFRAAVQAKLDAGQCPAPAFAP